MEENHPTLEQSKLAQIEALNISYAEFKALQDKKQGVRDATEINQLFLFKP